MQRVNPTRASRDGDQFHYVWAARQCLGLLQADPHALVAVSVEGSSPSETLNQDHAAGEQVIDVALYYGSESLQKARKIQYIQLKHTTVRQDEAWGTINLKNTISGFARKYYEIIKIVGIDGVENRFNFVFTTNRPVSKKIKNALEKKNLDDDCLSTLIEYTELPKDHAHTFLSLFKINDSEDGLWQQRNLLNFDIKSHLAGLDADAPSRLTELVTRKATTEHRSNPVIRRLDLLRALGVDEFDLFPAPCQIKFEENLERQAEAEIRQKIYQSDSIVILHADGGIGKTTLSARLANKPPKGSRVVLYDCFGSGEYRGSANFRHRHRDAVPQIANELAGTGLCYPLIPSSTDPSDLMRAFLARLQQAVGQLRACCDDAQLWIIIDAADNAVIAAEEIKDNITNCFITDLMRTRPPEGVRWIFTCRSHRRNLLSAPPQALEISLPPFSLAETTQFVRCHHPGADDRSIAEFHRRTSANPRVQAQALQRYRNWLELLNQLGPDAIDSDGMIGRMLDDAIKSLRYNAGSEEKQIETLCQGLAILPPPIPVRVLATLSETSESAVRSFAADLGFPLQESDLRLHFRDEPTETWFRDKFQPPKAEFAVFLKRLRPLTDDSAYVSASLPRLLLAAGQLNELIDLALEDQALPNNPLERRNVTMPRLRYAIKACLQHQRHLDAAKLALKAAGECAGQERQHRLFQSNTDLAAQFLSQDNLEDLIAHRIFTDRWQGSHYVFEAGLLSGHDALKPEARSRLRIARRWLEHCLDTGDNESIKLNICREEIVEFSFTMLRLYDLTSAADFINSWGPESFSFLLGCGIGKRLADLADYDSFISLAGAIGDNIPFVLGLALEIEKIGHTLPRPALQRLIVGLSAESGRIIDFKLRSDECVILDAVRAAISQAIQILPLERNNWAAILRRYLPDNPPEYLCNSNEILYNRDIIKILRSYALEASLRQHTLVLDDLAPKDIDFEPSSSGHISYKAVQFKKNIIPLLKWAILEANTACNIHPANLATSVQEAQDAAQDVHYRHDSVPNWYPCQEIAQLWFAILRRITGADTSLFLAWWKEVQWNIPPKMQIELCRQAVRSLGCEEIAWEFARIIREHIDAAESDATSRINYYADLARSLAPISREEAGFYFNRAIQCASNMGDDAENRWHAMVQFAEVAGKSLIKHHHIACRLAQAHEIFRQYIDHNKYDMWSPIGRALAKICPEVSLVILSRWRDRNFGCSEELLAGAIDGLTSIEKLSVQASIIFTPLELTASSKINSLKRFLDQEPHADQRRIATDIVYRYLRVERQSSSTWSALQEIQQSRGLEFPGLNCLAALNQAAGNARELTSGVAQDWKQDWRRLLSGRALTDPLALRSIYEGIGVNKTSFFSNLPSQISYGQASEILRILGSWPDLNVFSLNEILNAMKLDSQSFATKAIIKEILLKICKKQPILTSEHRITPYLPFEKIASGQIATRDEIRQARLRGFADQVENLDASGYLDLASTLADELPSDQALEALVYSLDLLDKIAPSSIDNDIPHPPTEAETPSSPLIALAGYIWVGLGAPEVATRWRYAHVVRCAVELGWTELIAALVEWAERDNAAPFTDPRLQFYLWHARQWLALGLARGALERPSVLQSAQTLLTRWLNLPHVLIRSFSAQALTPLSTTGEQAEFTREKLKNINVSPFLEILEGENLDKQTSVLDRMSDPGVEYLLGWDASQYWLSPLRHAFGLPHHVVGQHVIHAATHYLKTTSNGRLIKDARYEISQRWREMMRHSHGSRPECDGILTYTAYHSMMIAAGKLLESHPAVKNGYSSENEWLRFVADEVTTLSDGRWLSDFRDPIGIRAASAEYQNYNRTWSVTAAHLDRQMILHSDRTVLWGSWETAEENIYVLSAFVPRTKAPQWAWDLQCDEELNIREELGEDYYCDHETSKCFRRWLKTSQRGSSFEKNDPWSGGLDAPGPAPDSDMIQLLSLTEHSDRRQWFQDGEAMFQLECWSERGFEEGEDIARIGRRLSASAICLSKIVEAYPDETLLIGVQIQSKTPLPGERHGWKGLFPEPYVRLYLLEADGPIYIGQHPRRPSSRSNDQGHI